jgi:hypothetical protein
LLGRHQNIGRRCSLRGFLVETNQILDCLSPVKGTRARPRLSTPPPYQLAPRDLAGSWLVIWGGGLFCEATSGGTMLSIAKC